VLGVPLAAAEEEDPNPDELGADEARPGVVAADAVSDAPAGINVEPELVRPGAVARELAAKNGPDAVTLLDTMASALVEAPGLLPAALELQAASPPNTGSSAKGRFTKPSQERRDNRMAPGYHVG
jgi:hypothetical protein